MDTDKIKIYGSRVRVSSMDDVAMKVKMKDKCMKTITNDGATILKSIHIDNAAAKVLVEISKTQDDEVGDGTTSVVVLAGELLREAQKLMDKRVHPMTIIDGWRLATDIARKALISSAVDATENKEKLRKAMIDVAQTTLSSKILSSDKNKFAELAVDAVLRLEVAQIWT